MEAPGELPVNSPHMFGPEANSDHARRYPAEEWKALKQPYGPGRGDWLSGVKDWLKEMFMQEDLHALRQAGGKLSSGLDREQIFRGDLVGSQFIRNDPGGGHGVLNGEINSHSAYGRHGMRTIPNAKQPVPTPRAQSIDFNAQKLHLSPIFHLAAPVMKKRCAPRDFLAEFRQSALSFLLKGILGNDISTLPIVASIQQHHKLPETDEAECLRRIPFKLRDPKPKDVDRSTKIARLKLGSLAYSRAASIGPNHETGAHLKFALWRARFNPNNPPVFPKKIGDLRFHANSEVVVLACLTGKEFEKIPLRHEGNEFAAGRKMGEIGHGDNLVDKMGLDLADLLVRLAQEFFQKPQLMHQLQSGGMNGVAAEITKKVLMFFQDKNLHAGAGEKETQHDSGGAASRDAAPCAVLFKHWTRRVHREGACTWSLNAGSSTDEMKDKYDQREHEQYVNETTGNVDSKSNPPKKQKKYGDNQKHTRISHPAFRLVVSLSMNAGPYPMRQSANQRGLRKSRMGLYLARAGCSFWPIPKRSV